MNKETLQKANELNRKKIQLEEALESFHYENQGLIIEFDAGGDDMEQIKLPMTFSDALLNILKTEIEYALYQTEKEFEAL